MLIPTGFLTTATGGHPADFNSPVTYWGEGPPSPAEGGALSGLGVFIDICDVFAYFGVSDGDPAPYDNYVPLLLFSPLQ